MRIVLDAMGTDRHPATEVQGAIRALRELPGAETDMHFTMVVPPAQPLQPDYEIRERLAALDRELA